jgi:hypothetical protein
VLAHASLGAAVAAGFGALAAGAPVLETAVSAASAAHT